MGTSESTSKPSRTLPRSISITVTLSTRSKPTDPPTMTDSWLFLVKTNIVKSSLSGRSGSAPGFRGHVAGKKEYLDHRPGRKRMDDGAGGRLDFRGRLAHLDAGNLLDFLAQWFGGVAEQLAVKLLHLGGAFRTLGQRLLGWRQSPVQRDHHRVFTQDHGRRLGSVAGAALLEGHRRLSDLLGHG